MESSGQGPFLDTTLYPEGTLRWTQLYKDKQGNEMFFRYQDCFFEQKEDAKELIIRLFLETAMLGLYPDRLFPLIMGQSVLVAPASYDLHGIEFFVGVIAGPLYDQYVEANKEKLDEGRQKQHTENAATHQQIVYEDEAQSIPHCTECKGTDRQLYEQTCIVRQTMNQYPEEFKK